ncbi:uncharacterized protein LOC133183853 [Saccostrea echinata]|uniref:uncharacterized protein LOC133183853 n=1 Tax=Saccostrea echinata TaxID=191078 RepID=UPI002A825419|nr:uncharacterized protein LOC133183853 [Saccostrea echinata]
MSNFDETISESPRKRQRQVDDSRQDHEDDLPFNQQIPSRTSDWREIHLSRLNIEIDCSTLSAIGVLTYGYTEFLKNDPVHPVSEVVEKLYASRNPQIRANYECCMFACMDFLTIDSDTIFDISSEHIKKLIMEVEKPFRRSKFGKWLESFLVGKGDIMKDYVMDTCRSIHIRVKDFCDQLLYMVECGEIETRDEMYRELFMLFLRIFDIKMRQCANYKKTTSVVAIGEKTIISIPDALICKTTKTSPSSEKVLAVIEVKKYGKTYDRKLSENLHNTEKGKAHDPIGSNLKGKHVGDMVAALPESVFGLNGIYGIIVQGTEVTLSSMAVGENWFEHVTSGSLHSTPVIVKHSSPYNILRQRDRENLIQTFVDMKSLLDHLV